MSPELKMYQPSTQSDACTYMWACAICDENETCQKDKEGHSRWLVAKRMERIDYKILVMSNKGGVGKSTVSTNLAVSLALKGYEVGICDMDIHGPNIPKMVGAEGQRLKISTGGGIIPHQAYNMKIASMSFLLQNSDDPIIWRDAYKFEFINQLLGGVEWQDLNFLIVDLPPGTGNESVTTIDLIGEVTGCVIVSTPRKSRCLTRESPSRLRGTVNCRLSASWNNMSGLDCPHCHEHIEVFRMGGGEASAHDMQVPFLGRIPLDPEVVRQSDYGEPYALFHSDLPTADAYHNIANQVDDFCKKKGSLVQIATKSPFKKK